MEDVALNTDNAWELWGRQDPYFGVLTDPKFRAAAMTPQSKQEFLHSGQAQVQHVLNVLRHHFAPAFMPRRVLDFGCGVGRTVLPFAAASTEVVGVDVSPSMLEEARRNCVEHGVVNASFVLSDDALSAVTGRFDLVHSSLVFQHIGIERGRRLFAALLDKLEPGGFGAIQLTFAIDVHVDSYGRPVVPPKPPPPGRTALLRRHLRQFLDSVRPRRHEAPVIEAPAVGGDPEMEMHFYELNDLAFLLQRAGVSAVFSEFTDHGGALGAFMYFGKKPASA